jgi:hypothetical protein
MYTIKITFTKTWRDWFAKNFIEIKHQNVSNPNRNGNGQQ